MVILKKCIADARRRRKDRDKTAKECKDKTEIKKSREQFKKDVKNCERLSGMNADKYIFFSEIDGIDQT